MPGNYMESISFPQLRGRIENPRKPISFELEITARCNNNCRHCYINLPERDKNAARNELSLGQIKTIADQAVDLDVMGCFITGGEPLLRSDFFDVYLYLKKIGLLVSVFTNATLLNREHIKLFRKYPPRDIEVTVYGVTPKTYERVTRVPGSFAAFMEGVKLLLDNDIKVRFKAMALRSNANELPEIAKFCRERTKDYFRFDPFLHLRFDRDAGRNQEIKSERLSSEEIVAIEKADPERSQSLKENCDKFLFARDGRYNCSHLFLCGAGIDSFTVSYDGFLRACVSLWHPDCVYNYRKVSLSDFWHKFIPRLRDMRSSRKEFLQKCSWCPILNLCIWCPAHSYLETGRLDTPVGYFCEVAHARKRMLEAAGREPEKS